MKNNITNTELEIRNKFLSLKGDIFYKNQGVFLK